MESVTITVSGYVYWGTILFVSFVWISFGTIMLRGFLAANPKRNNPVYVVISTIFWVFFGFPLCVAFSCLYANRETNKAKREDAARERA